MSDLKVVEGLKEVIVGQERKGEVVVKASDGSKLFTTSQDLYISWFSSVKTIKVKDVATAGHLFTLIETNKQLRNSKTIEVRSASDKLFGSAVMKKRFFWHSNELLNATGDKIASFNCDGSKFVFDGDQGTARPQVSKNKLVSFTLKFGPTADTSVKLLMIASAFIMIASEQEAQDAQAQYATMPK